MQTPGNGRHLFFGNRQNTRAQLGCNGVFFAPNMELVEIDMLLDLEDKLGIKDIPVEVMYDIETVRDLIDTIENL